MKLTSGTARNVRSTAATLSLDLDGQDVRLHKPCGKGLVEDGDDLVVAGARSGDHEPCRRRPGARNRSNLASRSNRHGRTVLLA